MLAACRFSLSVGLFALLSTASVVVADEARLKTHDFVGVNNCTTSGCHGGGLGRHQAIPWLRGKDPHSRDGSALASKRSQNMAQGMNIPDARTDTRCTTCHSPMESVDLARLAPEMKGTPDKGVSCEACHGPAEPWLRFHTRSDITRDQRMAAGMREMQDLYNRANVCVACHLYLEPELTKVGHPPLYFELAAQQKMKAAPAPDDLKANWLDLAQETQQRLQEGPHWIEEDPKWLEPRAWLVGQATALRELSWHAKTKGDEYLNHRLEALRWVLRLSEAGSAIPATGDAQAAADRLAAKAQGTTWTRSATLEQLRKFIRTNGEFTDGTIASDIQYQRGQALARAARAFYLALRANGDAPLVNFEQNFRALMLELTTVKNFDPKRFGDVLVRLEIDLREAK